MKQTSDYSDTGIFKHLGFDLPDSKEGWIRGFLDIGPEHLNRVGYVHGGVLATMLDAACAGSGLHSPPGQPPRYAVTISLNINFVRPALKGRLSVEGNVVSASRNVYSSEGKVFAQNGDLIAHAIGTFQWRAGSRPHEIPENSSAGVGDQPQVGCGSHARLGRTQRPDAVDHASRRSDDRT